MLEFSLISERGDCPEEHVTGRDATFATVLAMGLLLFFASKNFDLVSDRADSILLIPASPPRCRILSLRTFWSSTTCFWMAFKSPPMLSD
uniref:Uncharacterized protein n=1 Tax=Arundo donax TaxID=35708 RepID=A0A0A9EZR0_ARUDO